MTDVNIFVDKYAYLQISSNFETIKQVYFKTEERLSEYIEERDTIEKIEKWNFNFKRQIDLYNFLKYAINIEKNLNFYEIVEAYFHDNMFQYIRISRTLNDYVIYYGNLFLYLNIKNIENLTKKDFPILFEEFNTHYPNVQRYFELNKQIQNCTNLQERIINSITFDNEDLLVNIDDKLINLTKNQVYELSKDDTKFLTWCAKEKDNLIEDVTKEDLPFIKESIENFIKEKENNRPKYKNIENEENWYQQKEFYLTYGKPESLYYYVTEKMEKRKKLQLKR